MGCDKRYEGGKGGGVDTRSRINTTDVAPPCLLELRATAEVGAAKGLAVGTSTAAGFNAAVEKGCRECGGDGRGE
eukprot:3318607-Pleurochrysis_carterae.AAC.1